MSQIQLTGRVIAGQPFFDNGSFRKQTLIIEVQSGQYQNYYPVDFTQGDIDSLLPQVQMGGTYTFTCYVQGSNKQMTDKNGSPTAYLNLKVSALAQASAGLPPTSPVTAPQQQFQQPQQQQGFAAPAPQQGGFGAPQQQQGGFIGGQPQQQAQGFGAQQAQPASGFGTPTPAANQGFGNPPANGGGFGQQ